MDSEEFTNGEDKIDRLIRENEALLPDIGLPICASADTVYKRQITLVQEWNKKRPNDDSNEEFRKKMRILGNGFHISDSELNQFLKPIDCTCPFLLDVKEVFGEFNRKRLEDKSQSKSKSSNSDTTSTAAAASSSAVSLPPVKKPKIVKNNPVKLRVETNRMTTRSATQTRANWDRLRSNPLGNMTIGSVQPTILSKTGHQIITPDPEFILAQIPPQIHTNRRNMRLSTTESKTPPPHASNSTNPSTIVISNLTERGANNQGEEEMDNVPKIVSLVGNATMPAPTNAVVNLTNLAEVAGKACYPEKRTISGTQYVVCKTCNEKFPSNCLQLYRNHMKIQHAIEIQPFTARNNKNDIQGSVGQVVRVGANRVTTAMIPNSTAVNHLYRCKTCNQLLQESEILEHVSTSCPIANVNVVFEIVNPDTTKIGPNVFCGLCDCSFTSNPELRNHFVRQHKEHAHKMILEPMCRCSNCLTVFEDSIHLGAHVVGCNARKVASGNIVLDLARAMLKCGLCKVSHNTISQTQECYTKAGFIRCLLCLYTVESRGNFFSHMKSYHAKEGGRGIRCSFCEVGEQLNFRDLFIHVLENHYNPILQLHSPNSSVLAHKGLATPVLVPQTIQPSIHTPSSASQILNQTRINDNLLHVSRSSIGFRTLNPNVTTTAVLRRMGTPIPIQVPGFRPILPVHS